MLLQMSIFLHMTNPYSFRNASAIYSIYYIAIHFLSRRTLYQKGCEIRISQFKAKITPFKRVKGARWITCPLTPLMCLKTPY